MNTKLTALTLAAASAFAFTPKPAEAGDKGAAIVGGLIGGLIIGAALSDHHDSRTVVVRDDHCDDGYWKTVSVNVWVPGYWVTEYRYGRPCRRWVEGRYDCRNDRVWVAYERRGNYGGYGGGHREIGRNDRYDRHDRYDRNDRNDRGGRNDRRDRR